MKKVALIAMLVTTVLAFGQTSPPSNQALVLVGGAVYVSPTEAPIRDGVVLVQGTKIAAVGTRAQLRIPGGSQVIDCSGLTITSGFWNSHVHFFERKWTNAAAIPAPELGRQLEETITRYGFTSVFDLGSTWENTRRIRARIDAGEVPGPRILSTGNGLIPAGGAPSETVVSMMGATMTPLHEIADAAQASAASKKVLEQGVDGLKLFVSAQRGATLPESAVQAAVDESHRMGRPVFAHPNTGTDVLTAVRRLQTPR